MVERRVLWLVGALIALSALFLLWQLRAPMGFILSLRGTKLASLILVGAATGIATVLFQTVAGNRLLTPGIVGFDALFVFIQTALVLSLGGIGYATLPSVAKFLFETGALVGTGLLLFGGLLLRDARDLTRMILTGVILGVMLRGLAEMMQRVMAPSEFAVVQQALFATFGAVDTNQLWIAGALLGAATVAALRLAPALDVAALGRDRARSLGLGYDFLMLQALALVAVLVAVATALVGPMTFLGLLAASLAREITGTHRHAAVLPAAGLMGALILVAGQFGFERLLSRQSALAVMVEFFGGLLFLLLVLRRRSV
ncbi:iron complex transport system permease protein [Poseidonocella pacifica]|uniref:Iron complex transport system permease protein n=1 Tax=Poseidonocella pacifica TaxID=871651 RepID=A0A1I0WRK9_9RHOB|nr:iron chelate uptake ABC transporter family permease subunit [Poseidonocella pacifica]SFA91402.1 iron complex transport system permease protein [Poseidonocella pacifica]